ncbi:Uncharacterised protein [uncultured archaeon]|nr:Uncharacterised protein [uncultured archaeon]
MITDTKDIKDSLSTIERSTENILKKLNDYNKKRAVANVYELEEGIENIEQSYSKFAQIVPLLDKSMPALVLNLKDDIKSLKNEFQREFSKELDRMFKEKGKELRGQLPTLSIEFYRLELDFGNGNAKIYFGQEMIKSKVPLDPSKIINMIDALEKEINDRKIDYSDFSKKLYEAFIRASKLSKSESLAGEQRVPVTSILNELTLLLQSPSFRKNPIKENFKGYSRWLFGYDLYKLRELKVKSISNKELGLVIATMGATMNEEDYIWVPFNKNGEGNRYSHIFFRDVVK